MIIRITRLEIRDIDWYEYKNDLSVASKIFDGCGAYV
jgi:hypothetical protein